MGVHITKLEEQSAERITGDWGLKQCSCVKWEVLKTRQNLQSP